MTFTITPEQLAQLDRDGFLVFENFVGAEALEELKKAAEEIVDKFEPKSTPIFTTYDQTRVSDDYFLNSANNISCFFEEHAFNPDGSLKQDKSLSINKIGHAQHILNPVFKKFSFTANIRDICHAAGFKRPLIPQAMYIFKQPRIGGEVSAHQDSTFLRTVPDSCHAFWFAIEDATRENGCLWGIPGSHKMPLTSVFQRKEDGNGCEMTYPNGEKPTYNDADFVPLEVKKGTMVFFHGRFVHKSYPNTSDVSRHAYTLHVVDGAPEHKWDETNWMQPLPGKYWPALDDEVPN